MAISIKPLSTTGASNSTLGTSSIPPLTTAQVAALNSSTISLGNISGGSSSTHYGAIPNITINGISPTYTYSSSPTVTLGTIGASDMSSGLTVKGDAEFYGDVTIKGKSISQLLEKMEHQLAIFTPNEALESRWEELRDLAKRYRELEADLRDKEKMWEILKR